MSFVLDSRFCAPDKPEGKKSAFEEAEARLLKQLEERHGKCTRTLWELAELYSAAGRHEDEGRCLERLIALTDDPKIHVCGFLQLGRLAEMRNDFSAGYEYYRQAYVLGSDDSTTWYFVNNNLAFCLNQLGRYGEAESYLKAAIEIEPDRTNAFKNLGLSLEGRGRYREAAEYFVTATRVSATDGRSLRHLEQLVAKHPELLVEMPDLGRQLDECRKAVKEASGRGP